MSNKNKEQAARTRQAILEAAIPIFLESGFTKARLQDIASAAGVTRGACYWHFKNKAEIFVELIETISSPVYARISELAESDRSPREKLRAIFFDVMTQMVQDVRFRSVIQIAWDKIEYTDEILDRLKNTEEQDFKNLEVIANIYAEGISSGEFKAVEPKVYAIAFKSYLGGLIECMSEYDTVIDYEENLEQLADFILPPEHSS